MNAYRIVRGQRWNAEERNEHTDALMTQRSCIEKREKCEVIRKTRRDARSASIASSARQEQDDVTRKPNVLRASYVFLPHVYPFIMSLCEPHAGKHAVHTTLARKAMIDCQRHLDSYVEGKSEPEVNAFEHPYISRHATKPIATAARHAVNAK